jgi:hypothetical protein
MAEKLAADFDDNATFLDYTSLYDIEEAAERN